MNNAAMNMAPIQQIHRWRAFAVLAVSFFMTIVDLTIVNVALPTIGRDLHFSESNLQWIVTAYAITFGGFLLLGGRAADLLGRRRILMLGLAVFTAASLGAGLATSSGVLIVMRGLQGLGAAIVLPAALSIVMNMFAEGAERNKALGVWGGIGAAGATVGLIAGGLLTRYAGWEYIFFLNVPIGAVALLLAPRIVPESRLQGVRRRYDPLGAMTVTGALLLLVYAVSKAPDAGWGSAQTVTLLAVSAALLLAFLLVETRAEAPLLPLRIFRLRTVAVANVVGLLLGASFFAFIFIGTLYMQQVLGYSALQAGGRLASRLADVGRARRTRAVACHPRLGWAGDGGRDGDDRRRRPVGDAGTGAGALLEFTCGAVLRGRGRHSVRLRADFNRRPERRSQAGGRTRLGAA